VLGSVNDGVSGLHVSGFIINESSNPPGGQKGFQFNLLSFKQMNEMVTIRIGFSFVLIKRALGKMFYCNNK
jgi:hypothetical protein